MPNFRVLHSDELDKLFTPMPKRALREEEMRPYREAVDQLSDERPGGVAELEIDENPRLVMMRLHRAARDKGLHLRFQRHGKDQRELRFRLQTPEETERLKERGRQLGQSRTRKRG